jgi:hypothetical protein
MGKEAKQRAPEIVELDLGTRSIKPTEVTPVTLAPKLDLLPTHEMAWENLEALLRRMAKEVLRRFGDCAPNRWPLTGQHG